MKKVTAALAALVILVSLTACRKQPATAEAAAAQPAPAVSGAQPEPAQEPETAPAQPPAREIEPEPAQQDGEADVYTGVFTDEPLTLAADVEEIVSYSITVPQVTLDHADAAQYINEGFAALADSLVQYAQETVYKTAQEKGTIGFLEGDYTITIDATQLIVDYTRTERYAGEELAGVSSRTFCFDVLTGEQVVTE